MSVEFRRAIRPPSRLRPWEWAAKNVAIQNSERSPKFDPEQTPWWKAPMDCAADYETREVVVVAPTGSGKSTMAEALIPYIVAENPGPLMYSSQTDANAKFWAETRLVPALKSCNELKTLWPKDRHASRKMEIIFPHMPIVMTGANMSSFQEQSVRWLYGDECWRWDAGLINEFRNRLHKRYNRKMYLVSQASLSGADEDDESSGDEFWQNWIKTDQAEFSWQCKCGECQPFTFEQIKWDKRLKDDGTLDKEATAKTAQMECRKCGARYDDTPKIRRQLAGSNMDNGNLGYIITNPSGRDGHKGFHVCCTAIWWIPWADAVLEFLDANEKRKMGVYEDLRQFTQKRRAVFWSEQMGDTLSESLPITDYAKTDYENGQKTDNEQARFATIDVGGDHFWMIIASWSNGKCKVLWEGYILSQGGDEPELAKIVSNYNVPAPFVLIDVGYDTDRIMNLCAAHGWLGIKGDGIKKSYDHAVRGGKTVERLYSKTKRRMAGSGKVARYILMASNPIKDILARMVDAGRIEFPSDVSAAMGKHMKAERRITERNSKTGEEKKIWTNKNGRANHLFDCMYYQVGAALAARVFDES